MRFNQITPEDDMTIGGGHEWEPTWLKDKRIGLYAEKYQVETIGKELSRISFIYDLKEFKPEYGYPL